MHVYMGRVIPPYRNQCKNLPNYISPKNNTCAWEM